MSVELYEAMSYMSKLSLGLGVCENYAEILSGDHIFTELSNQ